MKADRFILRLLCPKVLLIFTSSQQFIQKIPLNLICHSYPIQCHKQSLSELVLFCPCNWKLFNISIHYRMTDFKVFFKRFDRLIHLFILFYFIFRQIKPSFPHNLHIQQHSISTWNSTFEPYIDENHI